MRGVLAGRNHDAEATASGPRHGPQLPRCRVRGGLVDVRVNQPVSPHKTPSLTDR